MDSLTSVRESIFLFRWFETYSKILFKQFISVGMIKKKYNFAF